MPLEVTVSIRRLNFHKEGFANYGIHRMTNSALDNDKTAPKAILIQGRI